MTHMCCLTKCHPPCAMCQAHGRISETCQYLAHRFLRYRAGDLRHGGIRNKKIRKGNKYEHMIAACGLFLGHARTLHSAQFGSIRLIWSDLAPFSFHLPLDLRSYPAQMSRPTNAPPSQCEHLLQRRVGPQSASAVAC